MMRLPVLRAVVCSLLASVSVGRPGLVLGLTDSARGVVVPPSAQAPASTPATRLIEGQVLDREIAAGETHRYEIELQQGEYLQVDIQQHGVDVSVEVTGPTGQPVLATDTPGGEVGPEPVAFVATVSGLHRLALTAEPRPWPPSRYELRVTAVRLPTATDRMRASAVRDNAEVLRLLKAGDESSGQAMLDRLHAALKGWEALGEPYLQLWTESQIGWTKANLLDQFLDGYDHYSRALGLARQIGDDYSEAYQSSNVGAMAVRLGRLQEAEAGVVRALALDRAAGRRAREAVDLVVFGGFLVAAGRPSEAIDRLNEALLIFQDVPYAQLAGRARILIADAYMSLAEHELAIESYRSALPSLGQSKFQALVHRQIGLARFRLGDLEEARAAYDSALTVYRKLGNRSEEAVTTLLMGALQREQGDLATARDTFLAALPALRAAGDRLWEAKAQCELAETLRRLGERQAARQALDAAQAGPGPLNLSASLCVEEALARVLRDSGDLGSAGAHAQRAVDIVEGLRSSAASPRWRASALAAHQGPYELLVDVRMRQHDRQPSDGYAAAALEAAERARARTLLDLLSEGGIDVREGIAPELRAEERVLHQRLNVQAVAREDALAQHSQARADMIGREIEQVAARLAEVEARIRRGSPHYAALTQPQPLTLAEIRARVLDADTQLLQYSLGEAQSYLWVVSAARLDSFRLPSRERIEQAARRVYESMSRPPAGARGQHDNWEVAAEELSRLILAPAAGALSAKRVVVVAPDALQYVPFASLPLPDGTAMASRFELVSTPSASVIATLRGEARERSRGARAVAVFADPVFELSDPRLAAAAGPSGAAPARVATRGAEPGDPLERALQGVRGRGIGGGLGRLPFSGQEAEAIVALVPGKEALKATGFEASREAATSPRLAEYRIVHFATHGVLNTRRPELSGVVLSLFDDRGRRQDGFLRLHDVYNLRLGADLIVLSGCQTGLGKDLKGEGLVGLTRGFMYAGAPRVVASLWQVDDESTAELMKRFYRAMLKDGRRPADALRTAQLEMSRSRRWSAPFYWAGFVLQGEWR